jgi:Immunity protein 8
MGHDSRVNASLRSIEFDPEPSSLPADPEHFAFRVRLLIGPSGGAGEELFDTTVCSPEWLAAQWRDGAIIDGHHKVIVALDQFDQNALQSWFAVRVGRTHGESWQHVSAKLSSLAYWEFDNYSEYRGL